MPSKKYDQDGSVSEEPSSLRKRRARYTKPNSPTSVDTDVDSDFQDEEESLSSFEQSREENNSCRTSSYVSQPVEPSAYNPSSILTIILILIMVVGLGYCIVGKESQPIPSLESLVKEQIAQLKKSFPGQSDRLWGILRTTIASPSRFSASLSADARIGDAPRVLLIAPSSDPSKNESYGHFLKQFQDSLFNISRQWKCVDIQPFRHLPDKSPDSVKRNMHNQMVKAYESGRKCLHVVGIDRLPGEAALALHGNTDPLNSFFKYAFLLLSIQRPPPNIHNQTSQRDMETHLRNYLRSIWEENLGGDETYALINRLTGRIGIFEI